MTRKLLLMFALLGVSVIALTAASPASAKSSIKVGVADQSPRMFDDANWKALKLKQTRYFVPSDVLTDDAERLKLIAFLVKARASKVKTLVHISTQDLASKKGPVISTSKYKRDIKRIVSLLRKYGVREFGAWNEVNHKTQETWNRIGNAVSYFKSMYSAVRKKCKTCTVVGLDILDQAGADRYIRSFYKRLSSTWRKRLKVVGIHNYSDVNRARTRGTKKIIDTVRRYNRKTKFWYTETGALASFQRSFRYSESRQKKRIRNMFSSASKFKSKGVQRIYSYNWYGAEPNASCGSTCKFDAGLVNVDGSPRPVYSAFKSKLKSYSR